jgi:hypothetical protein
MEIPDFPLEFLIVKASHCFLIKTSHGQLAALEALQCGPSTDSEKRYFGAKSIRSLENSQILALRIVIFQKCGPRVDLGWPWLIKTDNQFENTFNFDQKDYKQK